MFSRLRDWLGKKILGYEPLRAKVKELDDEGVFLWIAKEDKADTVRDTIEMAYQKHYNRSPDSTHVVTESIDELEKLDKERLEKLIPE